MAKKSQAETVTLRLQETISGPADKALGALGRLEAQIIREQAALGRLETSLVQAKAKLGALAEGAPDAKAVAAFEKQKAIVDELATKLSAAGGASEELASKLQAAQAKLAGLEQAASAKVVNLDVYRKQSAAVASMGDRAAAQKDKIAGLRDKLAEGGKEAASMKPKLDAAGEGLRALGVSGVDGASKMGSILRLFTKMGPEIAIVVVGVVALTASLTVLGGVLYKAISSASDLREQFLDLRTAGIFWWDSNRANASGAQRLTDAIDKVAGSSAVARDKIVDYATQLANSRFQGKQLETALAGMAVAGAAGGDKLASQFLGLAQNARFFGQDLDKLTERFTKKFGAVAEARLLSLSVQFQKFGENITWIFSGADIEPFLRGLHTILDLFSKNTSSAHAMRDTVTRLTEAAIGGFLRLAIFLVKTYIRIRTHQAAWKSVGLIVTGVKAAFVLLGVLAGEALAFIAVNVAAVLAALGLFSAAIGAVINAFNVVWDYFKTHSWAEIGSDIIHGIVEGLKAAGSLVLTTLKGIVMGAVDGVKKYLMTGSPSRLMKEDVGYPMGTGISAGHEKAEPEVKASAASMVKAGVGSASAAANDGGSMGGGGKVIHLEFNNCSFGGDLDESKARVIFHKVLESEGFEAAVFG